MHIFISKKYKKGDKMKKLILLLIMTFLITGCSCNYTLKIDDKVSEEIEVVVPNSISDTKKNQVDNILKDLNPIIDDYDHKYKYNVNKKVEGNSTIYNLDTEYDNYKDSTLLAQCFEHAVFEENDDYIIINASGKFGCLYDNDEIKINIKTDKYVSSNNANLVNKNTYTWKIDRSNRDDVSIKATIMKNMADKEVEPKVIFKNVFKAIMVFLLICGGIYLYLQIEKGNKI